MQVGAVGSVEESIVEEVGKGIDGPRKAVLKSIGIRSCA